MANGLKHEKLPLEEEILAPYNHLIQVRGKHLREKIVLSFNYWLKVPEVRLREVIDIMKMLHNAGLLLDDVQDNSLTRRGLPSAHCVYGVPLTLNATVQIMMKAAQKAAQLMPCKEGAQLLIDHIYDAVIGQGFEIHWRDACICPTEDEYLKMLTLKTGKMLLLGVKLVQLFSQNKKNYDGFVERIGLYLQLRDDYCTMGHEEALEEMPGEEDILVRGKQFRNRIVMAFNHWFKVPEDKLQSILEVATMVHNATLMVDDIQDNSVVRRGLPAAHCVYGLPLTINAAVQVLTMAMQKALELVPDGQAANIYAEQFVDAVYGQGVDIYWRENFVCPTETEHENGSKKIIMLGVKLLQLFSENKTNYDDFVMLLGMYFQLRDDYCNLKQQEALEEWPGVDDIQVNIKNNFCEDITEGKFSLPIIHAMSTPEGPQVLNILRQRTRDEGLKKYCVSLLEKSGSLQYTRDVLRECDGKARTELARLGGNPLMEALLDGLLSWKDAKE